MKKALFFLLSCLYAFGFSIITRAQIIGPSALCAGTSSVLSDAVTGGTWSSSNIIVATVDSLTGSITGLSAGTTTISYDTDGIVTTVVTVDSTPAAGTITGAPIICRGASATYLDTATGGAWSSSATAIATVSTSGNVTGIAAGTTIISYVVSNTCGTAVATKMATINPLPSAGTITGSPTVCGTAGTPLTDTATSGTWSSSTTTIATVSGTGIIRAVSAGTATISYSVTNSCGTSVASRLITVNLLPIAGSIAGSATVCVAATTALTDAATGGIWSSSATSVATAGGTGVTAGVSAGTTNISYSVTNICGTATATKTLTVNPLPAAGTIEGVPSPVCTGVLTTLTETSSGGVWGSTDPAIATIEPATGLFTCMDSGTAVLNYSVTNSCGTAVAYDTMMVHALPFAGSISGSPSVCVGSSLILTDTTIGGIWSGTSLAARISGGVVLGLLPGVDTVKYSVSNVCGTSVAARTIIIYALPEPETVVGGGSYCSGGLGLHVGLSATQTATFYQLFIGLIPIGIPITGIGLPLDFGLQTTAGVYSVMATSTTSGCNNNMSGSVTIAITDTTTPSVTITASPGLLISIGESDTLTAAVTGGGSTPAYQWYLNGTAIAGANTDTYISNSFFDGDSVSCEVTSSAMCSTPAGAGVIITLGGLGVNSEQEQRKFMVYPNPNHGLFSANLSSNTAESVTIIVTNILGEKISEISTVSNKTTEILLPNAVGVYFVTAIAADGNYIAKIIVTE